MPVGIVEPVNQALAFLISVLLEAMKCPFHVSKKNMRCNHCMLTYDTFFRELSSV